MPLAPLTNWRPTALREAKRFVRLVRGQRLRSRLEFAKQVIVLPEGPYEGEHWRPEFQPYAYHVLHLMDSLGFRKIRGTGCVQSGKTFNFGVIPLAWHIRERRENVVFGLPEMDMAETKWLEEIWPVFESSPDLRWLLPKSGRGSRGGFATLIKFRNGATLKFMGYSGKDSRRSGATAPVQILTEVDRGDVAAKSSRETIPVEQIGSRGDAFEDLSFNYEECTVTDEDARIWSEFNLGTGAELYTQCVGCLQPVLPGRDNLVGIDDAQDVLAAGETGRFCCPHCGVIWEEADRQAMVSIDRITPVHRGQVPTLGPDGKIVVTGGLPRTDRLSIRWNAFLNLFWKTKSIAMAEWRTLYSKKPEEQEVKREQFAWANPRKPRESVLVALTMADVIGKVESRSPLGQVPPNTKWLTRGVDVRGTQAHFVVRNWSSEDAQWNSATQNWDGGTWSSKAIDMGTFDVPRIELGQREALIRALNDLRGSKQGYRDDEGNEFVVNMSLCDGSWMEDVMFAFMFAMREREIPGWMVIMGRGQSEPPGRGSYVEPRIIDPAKGPVVWNGEQCHIRFSHKDHHLPFCMANTDHWKSFLHDGYATPEGKNGALSHFDAATAEEKKLLREYSKHLVAEKRIRRKVPRRGVVDVWINESDSPNHYLDCDGYSCVAANILGVRIVTREQPTSPPTEQSQIIPLTMPDGRPFLKVGN